MDLITLFWLGLGFGLMWLGCILSVVKFAIWLAESQSRERAFYALVLAAGATGCASSLDGTFSSPFFAGPEDDHHVQWVQAVKAGF